MRKATRIIGWAGIGTVVLGAGCVCLVALVLLALHADERASSSQPLQETILTVERLRGTATLSDGGVAYIYEARDPSGTLRDTMAPFEASPGQRIRWRYRRSRFLNVFLPVEAVLCGASDPC
jgi:hypothetical protein